jgi:hypothetical protein
MMASVTRRLAPLRPSRLSWVKQLKRQYSGIRATEKGTGSEMTARSVDGQRRAAPAPEIKIGATA